MLSCSWLSSLGLCHALLDYPRFGLLKPPLRLYKDSQSCSSLSFSDELLRERKEEIKKRGALSSARNVSVCKRTIRMSENFLSKTSQTLLRQKKG